jgi:hypothetical protein
MFGPDSEQDYIEWEGLTWLHICKALKSIRCTPTNRLMVASGVSNFLRLECSALAPTAVAFFGVWIEPRAGAAVVSVQPLRMSADAHFITLHGSPRPESMLVGVAGNQVFALEIRNCFQLHSRYYKARGSKCFWFLKFLTIRTESKLSRASFCPDRNHL